MPPSIVGGAIIFTETWVGGAAASRPCPCACGADGAGAARAAADSVAVTRMLAPARAPLLGALRGERRAVVARFVRTVGGGGNVNSRTPEVVTVSSRTSSTSSPRKFESSASPKWMPERAAAVAAHSTVNHLPGFHANRIAIAAIVSRGGVLPCRPSNRRMSLRLRLNADCRHAPSPQDRALARAARGSAQTGQVRPGALRGVKAPSRTRSPRF